MTVIIDDEDRENEGDLVLPAQMVTPDAVNFMARHGRGLICLALGRDRAETLGLELMSSDQKGRFGTAFTQSIEARDGVTNWHFRSGSRADHRPSRSTAAGERSILFRQAISFR